MQQKPSLFQRLFKREKNPDNFRVSQKTKKKIAELTEEEVILEKKLVHAENEREKQYLREEKEKVRWELETFIIQKSTRTTFPWFIRLHNRLRLRYRWYYNWHLLPYSGTVHWAALFTAACLLLIFLIVTGISSVSSISAAATHYWDGGGTDGTCGGGVGDGNKWSCALNWVDDSLPAAGDTVTFNGTSTKNAVIDTNVSVNGFVIDTNYTGTVQLLNNGIIVNSQSYLQRDGFFNLNGGTVDNAVSFWLYGSEIQDTGSGTIKVGGSATIDATGICGAGTMEFDSGDSNPLISVAAGGVFADKLVVNKETGYGVVLWSNLVVPDEIYIQSGYLNVNSYDLTVTAGTFNNDGTLMLKGNEDTLSFTHDTDSGSVKYAGVADPPETYNSLAYGNLYHDLEIKRWYTTYNLGASVEVGGDFSMTTESTFDANGFDLTIDGNFYADGGYLYTGTGTVTFGDALADTVVMDGGRIYVEAANVATHFLINAGTWTNVGSIFIYSAAAPTNTIILDIPYRYLWVNSVGSTYNLSDDLTADQIAITNGTLDVTNNDFSIDVQTSFTNDDTFVPHNGIVSMSGAGNFGSNVEGAGKSFANVTIKTGGQVNLYGSGLTVTGNLIVEPKPGAGWTILSLSGNTLTVGGNFTVAGKLAFDSTSTVPTPTLISGSYVAISSNVDYAIPNWDYSNSHLELNGSGTITFSGPVTCQSLEQYGPLTQGANQLTINGAAVFGDTFTGGSADIDIAGSFETYAPFQSTSGKLSIGGDYFFHSGFNANNGTVAFDGANGSTQRIWGSTTFYNLEITTDGNSTGRTIQFEGNQTQTITGPSGLTILGAAGKILTLASTNGNNWTINPTWAYVAYADISRSTNTGVSFCSAHSTDSGNNVGWTIYSGSCNLGGSPAGSSPTPSPTVSATPTPTSSVTATPTPTPSGSSLITVLASPSTLPDYGPTSTASPSSKTTSNRSFSAQISGSIKNVGSGLMHIIEGIFDVFTGTIGTASSSELSEAAAATARESLPVFNATSVIVYTVSIATGTGFLNTIVYGFYGFNLLLEMLGFRKKRKPWGVVYDSQTKAPVALAIVRIFRSDQKKLIQTKVTDKDGRFGFLVEPGQYYLSVTKPGYVYASKIIVPGTIQDDVYTNLYHGEPLKLSAKQTVVDLNIPLDPQKASGPTFGQKIVFLRVFIKEIIMPILVVSLALNIFYFLVQPNYLQIIFTFIISLMLAYEIFEIRQHFRWGVVYDSKTKQPLVGALVRIYDDKINRLREQKVTDSLGRYGFLVRPGEYYLKVIKTGYQFPSKKVTTRNDGQFHHLYRGEIITKVTRDAAVFADIPMDKEE